MPTLGHQQRQLTKVGRNQQMATDPAADGPLRGALVAPARVHRQRPPPTTLVRRGQEGTHWDSHVVTMRSQPMELRRGSCATRFYFRLS